MVGGSEIPLAVAGAALFNAVVVGIAWGNLGAGQRQMKKDMTTVKKALGLENGDKAVFVRKDELTLMRENAALEHDDFKRRFDRLEAAEE